MRVLFITSEFDDFVSVGGLAAVSSALPRALRAQTDVRIVLPGYREVLAGLTDIELVGECAPLAELPACSIARTAAADGLPIYIVMCPPLYDRPGGPYGDGNGLDWLDNDVRFARLASAAALLAQGAVDRSWRADLVHCNDWQSALTPAYLAWSGVTLPTILTIHNLAYQGLFAKETLGKVGAPAACFQIDGPEFYGKFSFLKAGLVYSSHLTTVSQTYANEITNPEFGCGLDGLLRKRAAAGELTGIVNGIDETWDPRRCDHLASRFSPGDWKNRKSNSDHVRREFGLALGRGPLFGLVARLVHQKGVDLVIDAASTIVAAGGQIVVMGKGDPHFEKALTALAQKHPQSIAVETRFSHGGARRIFAGSDFTLMPSRYEPCGLSQMYAQRFGSLPIGHRTGGLAETIRDGQTGFLFPQASAAAFIGAICRAFGTFSSKARLHSMRRHAMSQTFDWQSPAAAYRHLYKTVAA